MSRYRGCQDTSASSGGIAAAVVARPPDIRRHYMTREQHGHDPTVVKSVDMVAPADARTVYNDFKALLYSNDLCMAWRITLAGVYDLIRITVRDESTRAERVFVAPPAVTHSTSSPGSNAMGFVTHDVQHRASSPFLEVLDRHLCQEDGWDDTVQG